MLLGGRQIAQYHRWHLVLGRAHISHGGCDHLLSCVKQHTSIPQGEKRVQGGYREGAHLPDLVPSRCLLPGVLGIPLLIAMLVSLQEQQPCRQCVAPQVCVGVRTWTCLVAPTCHQPRSELEVEAKGQAVTSRHQETRQIRPRYPRDSAA